jgi:ABC-2 type transport system ATP-binding protein
VIILRAGSAVVRGPIRQLLHGEVLRTDVIVAHAPDELLRALEGDGFGVHARADVVVVEIEGQQAVGPVLTSLIAAGAEVVEVTPRRL